MESRHLPDYDPKIPVSAVVVNWNGREHLDLCLGSLLRQTLPGVELILVDNGSTDGSIEYVRERFGAAVRTISQATNTGYAAGLNAGIRAARGRYLFAVNNDTEIDAGCLAALVQVADRHPNAGSVAPKVLLFAERQVLDNTGHLLYPDGLSRGRGRLEIDHGQYDADADIILPSGCAVLLRRAMLADIGLYDEDFFAYCEDTDLGLRARLAGWTCRFVPDAIVYHKYSASSAHYSPLKAFLVERNRLWVAVKCLPWPILLANPFFTLLRFGAQTWGVLSRRGAAGRFAVEHSRGRLIFALLQALLAAFYGLPRAWQKRRHIQRNRRISWTGSYRWLTRYRMGVREVALKD